jgi:hypothetical protein
VVALPEGDADGLHKSFIHSFFDTMAPNLPSLLETKGLLLLQLDMVDFLVDRSESLHVKRAALSSFNSLFNTPTGSARTHGGANGNSSRSMRASPGGRAGNKPVRSASSTAPESSSTAADRAWRNGPSYKDMVDARLSPRQLAQLSAHDRILNAARYAPLKKVAFADRDAQRVAATSSAAVDRPVAPIAEPSNSTVDSSLPNSADSMEDCSDDPPPTSADLPPAAAADQALVIAHTAVVVCTDSRAAACPPPLSPSDRHFHAVNSTPAVTSPARNRSPPNAAQSPRAGPRACTTSVASACNCAAASACTCLVLSPVASRSHEPSKLTHAAPFDSSDTASLAAFAASATNSDAGSSAAASRVGMTVRERLNVRMGLPRTLATAPPIQEGQGGGPPPPTTTPAQAAPPVGVAQ